MNDWNYFWHTGMRDWHFAQAQRIRPQLGSSSTVTHFAMPFTVIAWENSLQQLP